MSASAACLLSAPFVYTRIRFVPPSKSSFVSLTINTSFHIPFFFSFSTISPTSYTTRAYCAHPAVDLLHVSLARAFFLTLIASSISPSHHFIALLHTTSFSLLLYPLGSWTIAPILLLFKLLNSPSSYRSFLYPFFPRTWKIALGSLPVFDTSISSNFHLYTFLSRPCLIALFRRLSVHIDSDPQFLLPLRIHVRRFCYYNFICHYGRNGSERPPLPYGKCSAARRLAKTGNIRGKGPLSITKCDKRPGLTVNAPCIIVLGKRPGANLPSLFSVGDGAVSEGGKYVLFIETIMPEMWVAHVFRNNSKTDNVRRRHSLCLSPVAAPRFPTRPPS